MLDALHVLDKTRSDFPCSKATITCVNFRIDLPGLSVHIELKFH